MLPHLTIDYVIDDVYMQKLPVAFTTKRKFLSLAKLTAAIMSSSFKASTAYALGKASHALTCPENKTKIKPRLATFL